MLTESIAEARRQIEICNACRYCEGYCSVFPAIHRQRTFADGDVTQFANLCHNCRGCYYACQYTEPHKFALNLPRILANVRHESWKAHAWPTAFAPLFDRSGTVISAVMVLSIALLLWLSTALRPMSGQGFYAHMSHDLMVAMFVPAFLLPIFAIAISLKRYWRTIGGGRGWLQFRGRGPVLEHPTLVASGDPLRLFALLRGDFGRNHPALRVRARSALSSPKHAEAPRRAGGGASLCRHRWTRLAQDHGRPRPWSALRVGGARWLSSVCYSQ